MRFTLPDDKTLTHQMLIPIRWGDMDAMGHAYIDFGTFDESPNSQVR